MLNKNLTCINKKCPQCGQISTSFDRGNNLLKFQCPSNHVFYWNKNTSEMSIEKAYTYNINTINPSTVCIICNGKIIITSNGFPQECICENKHRYKYDDKTKTYWIDTPV